MLPGDDEYFSLLSIAACKPARGGQPVPNSPLRREAKTRPRLGAFEVWLVWGDNGSDKVLLHSKLSTGRWPRMQRLINDLHLLIPWLLATPGHTHKALLDAHTDLKREHGELARDHARLAKFEALYDAAAKELEGKDALLEQCVKEKKAREDQYELLQREVEASAREAEAAKARAEAKFAEFKVEMEGRRQDEADKRKQALLQRTVARCVVAMPFIP